MKYRGIMGSLRSDFQVVVQHLHDIHAEVMTWLTTMKSHLTEIQLMLTPIQQAKFLWFCEQNSAVLKMIESMWRSPGPLDLSQIDLRSHQQPSPSSSSSPLPPSSSSSSSSSSIPPPFPPENPFMAPNSPSCLPGLPYGQQSVQYFLPFPPAPYSPTLPQSHIPQLQILKPSGHEISSDLPNGHSSSSEQQFEDPDMWI